MRRILTTLFIIVATAWNVAAQESAEKVAEQKKDALYQEAVDFIHTKRFEEGAQKLLEITRLKDLRADIKAAMFTSLGVLYRDSVGDFERVIDYCHQAEALTDDVLAVNARLKAGDPELDFSALMAYSVESNVLDSMKRYEESLHVLEKHRDLVQRAMNANVSDFAGEQGLIFYYQAELGIIGAYDRMEKYQECLNYCGRLIDVMQGQFSTMTEQATRIALLIHVAQAYQMACKSAVKLGDKTVIRSCAKESESLIKEIDAIIADGSFGVDRETMAIVVPLLSVDIASCYIAIDDNDRAFRALMKATEEWPHGPHYIFVADKLGDVYLRAGMEAEARAKWEEVRAIFPNFYDGVDESVYPLAKFGK